MYKNQRGLVDRNTDHFQYPSPPRYSRGLLPFSSAIVRHLYAVDHHTGTVSKMINVNYNFHKGGFVCCYIKTMSCYMQI